jgi:hypothetical protein
VRADHVGLDPVDLLWSSTIDKDQPLRIKRALVRSPTRAPTGHVGAILFAGVQAFFEARPLSP